MYETFRKAYKLIGSGQGGRWFLVAAIALAVSGFEAMGTLLIFALLGLLVQSEEAISLPVIGRIDHLVPGLERDELIIWIGVAVAAFFLVRGVVIAGQAYVQYRIAENAGARLSARLLDGYLSMPFSFHLERNSSELIRNAFDSVQRFVGEGLIPGVRVASKVVIVMGILGVLLATVPVATLMAVAVLGPFLWAVLRFVHPRVKRLGRTAQSMARRNLQALQQCLNGVRDIVILAREDFFVDAYRRDRRRLARTRYLKRTASELPRVAIETGVVLFIVAFLAVVLLPGGNSSEVVPVIGLFGYAAVRVMPELNQITIGLNSLKFVGPAVDDIYDDLIAFDQEHPKGSLESLPFSRCIDLVNVSFAYPGTRGTALRDINLTIKSGESIGIVGPTGSGKTTLINLILGLLEPTQGVVLVDSINIRHRLRGWQANIGMVPQNLFLIDDTIRRNVALGMRDGSIDDTAVWNALRLAQIDQFVAALPDGLESIVGEDGVRISGGQRQRLAIARALYPEPSVLVFDEGTSALDTETEAGLMAELEQLRLGRTIIMIAHRPTTVQSCDRVVVVRDGRIVDVGPYEQLGTLPSSFDAIKSR